LLPFFLGVLLCVETIIFSGVDSVAPLSAESSASLNKEI